MNKITAIGRLTKEITLKQTPSKITYCRFNLACKSKQKGEDGQNHTDYFMGVAWRSTAEVMAKYCKKGNMIIVSGFMNSRSYKNEKGETSTIWELNVEDLEFVSQKVDADEKENKTDNSLTVIDDDEEDLPF